MYTTTALGSKALRSWKRGRSRLVSRYSVTTIAKRGLRRMCASMTPQDVERFNEQGFLVLEGFASDEQISKLRQRAGELIAGFDMESTSVFSTTNQKKHTNDYFIESASNISFFYEEKAFNKEGALGQDKRLSINKIGHAMHDLDDVFREFSRSEKISNIFSAIGYKQPVPVQSMYIFKQPNIGGEVVPHQDSTFLYTDPPSTVGLWLALEKATVENGCLYILPGSHKKGLDRRFILKDGSVTFDKPAKQYDIEDFIPVEVGAGALVLLHGAVVHCSKENTSEKSRHAYSVHYIEGAQGHTWTKDNWLQRREDFQFEPLYEQQA